jgi:hypothetical protein
MHWLSKWFRKFSSAHAAARRLSRSIRLNVESLESRLVPANVFTVTNTNNAGAGSLAQAVLDSAGQSSPSTILFNIPGPGTHTIAPIDTLEIDGDVTIDGTSQPGYQQAGHPLIELSGSAANWRPFVDGLMLLGNDCVKGLAINRFSGNGIFVYGRLPTTTTLQADFIGTDATGTVALGNGGGVAIETQNPDATGRLPNHVTVGGTTVGTRNLISGNKFYGVFASGAGTVLEGNFIGTDITGKVALGNGKAGLDSGMGVDLNFAVNCTVGGYLPGAGNLISGNNGDGVVIESSLSHGVASNHVPYGPSISADGRPTLVKSDPITPASGNVVQGNFIGTDITREALANRGNGVTIRQASNNRIGGTLAESGSVVTLLTPVITPGFGSMPEQVGLSPAYPGNLIAGNLHDAIQINSIPTDDELSAYVKAANQAAFSTFPTTGADKAVLSTFPTTGNVVQGNFLGRIADNTAPNTGGYWNGGDGVAVVGATQLEFHYMDTLYVYAGLLLGTTVITGPTDTTIGGTAAGSGNYIVHNINDGISCSVAAGTTIQGNFIGTDLTETQIAPNGRDGIFLSEATNTTIGGVDKAAGNTIAWSDPNDSWYLVEGTGGVRISGGWGNVLQRNSIYDNTTSGIVSTHDTGYGYTYGSLTRTILTQALVNVNDSTVKVRGHVVSAPNSVFTVEFYANPDEGYSYDQGKRFLGSIRVTTNSLGKASFSATLPAGFDPGAHVYVTATATMIGYLGSRQPLPSQLHPMKTSFSNTSDFSNAISFIWPPRTLGAPPGVALVARQLTGAATSFPTAIVDAVVPPPALPLLSDTTDAERHAANDPRSESRNAPGAKGQAARPGTQGAPGAETLSDWHAVLLASFMESAIPGIDW